MFHAKNILVIEAGEALSPHMCLQMALAGCNIISLGRDEKKQQQLKKAIDDVRGSCCYYVLRDSGQHNTAGHVIQDIFDRYGGVHYVVNIVSDAKPEALSYPVWEANRNEAEINSHEPLTFCQHFLAEYAKKIGDGQNIIRPAHVIDVVSSTSRPASPDRVRTPADVLRSGGHPFKAAGQVAGPVRFSRLYLDNVDVPRTLATEKVSSNLSLRPTFSPTLAVNEVLNLLTGQAYRDVSDISLRILGRDVYALWPDYFGVGLPGGNRTLKKIRRGRTLDTFLQETQDRGLGVFAAQDFRRGDLILETTGVVLEHQTEHSIQIGWDRHLEPDPPVRFINHSCDPNAGVKTNGRGFPDIVAFRDLKAGQEITFDYAMTEFKHYERENPDLEFSLTCRCGAQNCRGKLGYFSELPETLKKKYGAFMSDYLFEISSG